MVDVGDVDVVVVIPVITPVFGPWIQRTHPVAAVLEARISSDNEERQAMDAKAVLGPEVSAKAVVGYAIATVATALLPGAMLRFPVTGAMLLPATAFHALLWLALRMLIAALLAGMLGGLTVAVGLAARLRGLLALVTAPQFLRLLRGPVVGPVIWPIDGPLLLGAVAAFLRTILL